MTTSAEQMIFYRNLAFRKSFMKIIQRETLVQKRWYQLNIIIVHTKHFEIAT